MPTLRPMTAIYLLRGEKILMLHREGSRVVDQLWVGSAGGHFEPQEMKDPKACVLRELWEELGITEDALADLKMRYITLRHTKGEIRENYYFFAELKEEQPLHSNEGRLQWFSLDELEALPMPLSARHIMDHYLRTGRFDDKLYASVAEGERPVFAELAEF